MLLILPAQRLWRWHLSLLEALGGPGRVQVRLVPGAPYPTPLRAWLALERRLFGPDELAAPLSPGALAPTAGDAGGGGGEVVDLTPTPAPGALHLRYDGRVDEAALFAALQAGRPPRLEVVDGAGRVLAASVAALEVGDELQRGLRFVHARLIALVLRALGGGGSPAVPPPPGPAGSAGTLAGFAARALASKAAARLTRGRSRQEDWRIALRPAGAHADLFDPAGFTPLPNPPGLFHADPFLFERDGRTHLFVEAYPWATRKGVIACAELDGMGGVGAWRTVLEAEVHLSYPQVFAWGGETWMLPETAGARRLELYRAARFPDRWERAAVMLEGVRIADATLLEHDGRWWLLASVATHGGGAQDEVFGWSAPSPMGPWTPHGRAPLVSDVRAGRPGGRFVRRDGRLYRPAQDGSGGYGSGLAWQEVTALGDDAYAERTAARWRGGDFGGTFTGVHSFSEAGGWQAIDLKSPRGRQTP